MNRRLVPFPPDSDTYWHVVDDNAKEIVGSILLSPRDTREPWRARKARLWEPSENWRSQYFATAREALVWLGVPGDALDERAPDETPDRPQGM